MTAGTVPPRTGFFLDTRPYAVIRPERNVRLRFYPSDHHPGP